MRDFKYSFIFSIKFILILIKKYLNLSEKLQLSI